MITPSCIAFLLCICVLQHVAECMQVFRGVHWSDDVFNHENVGFWHYLQPAYNVMGFISCAGTNFVIRSSAFAEAGMRCMYSASGPFIQ